MHKRSTLKRVTYKEGPHVRANGGTKANAPRDLDKGPHIRLLEEDKDEQLPGGVGGTKGSAKPSQHPVQMYFDMVCPLLLLITFHICIWREPTLKTIKGASLHLSQDTISYVKEKSREAPPLCIISLGSV